MTLYYISRLRDLISLHISHAACTEDGCIGNNVDLINYQTRHTDEPCSCGFYSVPEEKMRSIIDDGGIPVVRIKTSTDSQLSLEIRRATPEIQYVAISHVWSDGLGNPRANSLPQFQLKRLARSLKHLSLPMMYFSRGIASIPQINFSVNFGTLNASWGSTEWLWLDTLCIPVSDDDESSVLKMKAINQMAAIYAGAHQVLVLDSVMQQFTVADSDACHVLSQPSAAAWLGRCWTYQEAALAWTVQVECFDCSFNPLLLYHSKMDSNDTAFTLLPGTIRTQSFRSRVASILSFADKKVPQLVTRIFRSVPPGTRALLFEHMYYQLQRLLKREMCFERMPKLPLHKDYNAVGDFVLCWNALARRTTTMAADVHVIKSNFLGLKAFPILEMDSQEERVRALLWSLPGIPLSILFNRSKHRVWPVEQHGNRWMPLWPDRQPLTPDPVLQFRKGALLLKTGRPPYVDVNPRVIILDKLYLTHGSSTDIIIHDYTQQEWCRFVLHRLPGDLFDSNAYLTTAFILQEETCRGSCESSGDMAAACLHVSEMEDTLQSASANSEQEPEEAVQSMRVILRATFDCPSTVWALGPSLPPCFETLPRFEATSTCSHYSVFYRSRCVQAPSFFFWVFIDADNYLVCHLDVSATQEPLPRRLKIASYMGINVGLVMLCSPFMYTLLAMNILMIYQIAKDNHLFPRSVFITSCLTIITHSFFFFLHIPILGQLVWAMIVWNLDVNITPLAIGLVHLGLKSRYMGGLTTIDQALLGMLLSGHVPQILIAT